jgi:hypothetical protein
MLLFHYIELTDCSPYGLQRAADVLEFVGLSSTAVLSGCIEFCLKIQVILSLKSSRHSGRARSTVRQDGKKWLAVVTAQ